MLKDIVALIESVSFGQISSSIFTLDMRIPLFGVISSPSTNNQTSKNVFHDTSAVL